jgi:5-(carboxyamino)imidazole ribonucleotide synthase
MIAIAAANLGYKTHIYCPDKQSPAFQVTTEYTMSGYTDKKGLAAFASKVDVITYEFENIPRETIDYLEEFTPVR